MILLLAVVFFYIGVCIFAGHGLCRWRDRIVSHLKPGDDRIDDE